MELQEDIPWGCFEADHLTEEQGMLLFPPDPDALTRWLETQINFDAEWEERVSAMILKNLSLLFGEKFQTLRDLSKYRSRLAASA